MNWLMRRSVIVLIILGFVVGVGLAFIWNAITSPPQAPAKVESAPLPVMLDRWEKPASRSYVRPMQIEKKKAPKPKPKTPAPKKPSVQAPAPPKPVYTPTPANETLACIRRHESGGNYRIVSSTGYQGAYQLSPRYSAAWANRYGHGEWAGKPAHLWPPAVQDDVALKLGKQTHWRMWSDFTSYQCPGFIS